MLTTQTVTMAPTMASNSLNHVTLAHTTQGSSVTSSSLTTAQQLANQLVNATTTTSNATAVTTQVRIPHKRVCRIMIVLQSRRTEVGSTLQHGSL